jgi:tetratricopeptide (TPR) repeat protein
MCTSLERSILVAFCAIFTACQNRNADPPQSLINDLHLANGPLISCSPANKSFGVVNFEMDCNEKVQKDFNIAMELLHSFEYSEAEKQFAKVIAQSPDCAMAYWGVAMSTFHPLWEPPSEGDLIKGSKAISIAKSIKNKSAKTDGYINAVAAYYDNWRTTDARKRSMNFENAMQRLYTRYPADNESAIFYALSLDAAADPTDKTYARQRKAGDILTALYKSAPDHPGIVHYIIHTYDYPGIANFALDAAKRYADVAPSSSHALHMPSHIFTRLGLWDDCIRSNLNSVAAAKCYAESAGIKGHWDEELHGLDYLVYAYLQKGSNRAVDEQSRYLNSIDEVNPSNFKVAYAFAAIPSRIMLENRNWNGAATLSLKPGFPWKQFPWQEAIVHFARALGAAHIGALTQANLELDTLKRLRAVLENNKDAYKAKQVAIQIAGAEAWIALASGKRAQALQTMELAANMEDSTSKHPVTPGEVLPARELYADMLLEVHQYSNALQQYELALQKAPNRFNSLYGAGFAAQKLHNHEKAKYYYNQLTSIADKNSNRPELSSASRFLSKNI